jgi:ribosomal protein L37AE/L43A
VRIEQRRSRKCPHCLHPSSPEEREQFRIWRVEKGDIRSADPVKRDKSTANRRDLERALKAAVRLLEDERDLIAQSHTTNDENGKPDLATMDELGRSAYEKLDSEIQRFKKLIDTKAEQ